MDPRTKRQWIIAALFAAMVIAGQIAVALIIAGSDDARLLGRPAYDHHAFR